MACTIPYPKWDGTAVPFWPWNSTVRTDLEHLYRIYSIPTHDKHQWL